MVQEGEFEIWGKVLDNQSYALHHGYYVTRLPGNRREMERTWEESRTMEYNYLNGHHFWSKFKGRSGIDKLAEASSKRLSVMIEETFCQFGNNLI